MTNPKAIQMTGYEPYIPEGLVLPKVGDKVEIRVSGECEFRCPNGCKVHWTDATKGVVDDVRVYDRVLCDKAEDALACLEGHSSAIEACESVVTPVNSSHHYQVVYPCGAHLGSYAAAELTIVKE